jgi:hypothetical protein
LALGADPPPLDAWSAAALALAKLAIFILALEALQQAI